MKNVNTKKGNDSSKNFAELMINGYPEFAREQKRRKIAKSQIVYSLAIGITSLAVLIGSVACAIVSGSKKTDIVEKSNYDSKNSMYRAEQALGISEQFKNGLIDAETYDSKMLAIQDLDLKHFLKDNLGKEDFEKYENLKTAEYVSTIAVVPSAIACGVSLGMAAGFQSNEEKRKKLKELGIN